MLLIETVSKLAKHPIIVAAAKHSGEEPDSLAQQLFFDPNEKNFKDNKSGMGILLEAVNASVLSVERSNMGVAFYTIDIPDDGKHQSSVAFVDGKLTCW